MPDFSRISFNPEKDYTGVLLQQGRALVDAEWNEQCAVINEQMRRSLATLLTAFGDEFAPQYDEFQLIDDHYKIKLRPDVFFAQGVRCEPRSGPARDTHGNISIPSLGTIGLPQDQCTLSVHAWEKVVHAPARASADENEDAKLSDPALDGSDSGLRSQIVWRLQIDALSPRCSDAAYQLWIKGQRGRIQVRLLQDNKEFPPCLYRIEIQQDVQQITPNQIRLWQDTVPLDSFSWETIDEQLCIILGGRLRILFQKHKPYRCGDYWLIPYRGKNTSQVVGEDWLPPAGQHYYARVEPSASFVHDSTVIQALAPSPDANSPQRAAQATDPDVKLSSPKLVAATFLGNVHCLPLKRWLSTALLAEILTNDFDTFWYRLVTQLPQVAIGDAEVRREAHRLWNTARQVKKLLEPMQDPNPA